MGMASEDELRDIVLERVAAVHAKNAAPLADRQADDVITFDVLPPLHSRGSQAVAERTKAWFDGYATDIGYEVGTRHAGLPAPRRPLAHRPRSRVGTFRRGHWPSDHQSGPVIRVPS
jgi:hypothetical protein